MTYGLDPQLFVEHGPAVEAARARRQHASFRAWRSLKSDGRLELVENALRAVANDDCFDSYPIAL